mmetsp:Transcript_9626/g.30517  ORF Transcript_9626/g.30517 Transcript_9626/m.30517 type:complete len:236 (+) Transcript_9626:1122-1829(+)
MENRAVTDDPLSSSSNDLTVALNLFGRPWNACMKVLLINELLSVTRLNSRSRSDLVRFSKSTTTDGGSLRTATMVRICAAAQRMLCVPESFSKSSCSTSPMASREPAPSASCRSLRTRCTHLGESAATPCNSRVDLLESIAIDQLRDVRDGVDDHLEVLGHVLQLLGRATLCPQHDTRAIKASCDGGLLPVVPKQEAGVLVELGKAARVAGRDALRIRRQAVHARGEVELCQVVE